MGFSRRGFLFGAVVLLHLYGFVAVGQNPVILQYNGDTVDEYPLEVPGYTNTAISKIGIENITCLGDFQQLAGGGLRLTTAGSSTGNVSGRCLYNTTVPLMQLCSGNPSVTSFSATFQLMLYATARSNRTPEGVAFIIASDTTSQGEGGGYLGWLNSSTNGKTGHNFAVEIDFVRNLEFLDPVESHIGVDRNNLTSLNTTKFQWADLNQNQELQEFYLTQVGGSPAQFWVEYDGATQVLDVFGAWGTWSAVVGSSAITDIHFDKPATPTLSTVVDLTDTISQQGMFVGFSASISNNGTSAAGGPDISVTILEWTFNSDGPAPDVPRNPDGTVLQPVGNATSKRTFDIIVITVPSVIVFLVLVLIIFVLYRRNSRLMAIAKRYEIEEVLDRGPQAFRYRVLSAATKGFSAENLLGTGGFGSVYKGDLLLKGDNKPTSVAVKRISATSHQGAQEFLAEVKIIGRAQHRNLVRLLGWCHERGELLLVYDYMPNGSVDQHLFNSKGDTSTGEPVLTWSRRLRIVSGVASALAFLHEEWEQRVIHRDVKSSNVMLDRDFNPRLGDFGLARLSEHDQAPASTAVLAGTYGYMAPELSQTLKPDEKTDVYSFGATVLELATGRKALLSKTDRESFNEILLLNWVWGLFRDDALLKGTDSALQNAFDPREMVMFLKIGLLCCHPNPDERPTMREVINIWKGSTPFPPLPRSKPVPIFPLGADKLGQDTDEDADTTALCSTNDCGRADMSQRSIGSFTSAGDSALRISPRVADADFGTLETSEAGKGDSRDLSLRFRPRTNTSLPF